MMTQQRRSLLGGLGVAASLLSMAPASMAAPNAPYAVQVAYDPAGLKATVSWKADTPALRGFAVERRPVGKDTWVKVASLDEKSQSWMDAGIAPLVRYEYRVRAFRPGRAEGVDGMGAGYASASTAVTALDFPYERRYRHGIMPDNYSQAQMNADVRDMYQLWRAKYVTTAGAGLDGARVY